MKQTEEHFETQTRIIDDEVIEITPHSVSYLEWMDYFHSIQAKGTATVDITPERIRIRIRNVIPY